MVKPIPIRPSFIFRQACATPSLCRLRADLPSSLSWPPIAGCRPALHQRRTRGGDWGIYAHRVAMHSLRYNPRLSPPAALDGRPRIYFRSKRLDPWH
jgi:hypothetical protein